MVDTDSTHSESPKPEIPTIAQMARGSKENLMAISFSQRPKTPMRTYVVSGMLMSALGISLGFGIYLMFNPDHSEYSAQGLEGTPSVETDQMLISGLKKVVPIHNRKPGHHPTFGTPRAVDFAPASHAPISTSVPAPLSNSVPAPLNTSVPAPLVNQVPQPPHQQFAPTQHFVPATPPSNPYAPGAAGAAVPMTNVQLPVMQPIADPPHAITATTFAAMPAHNNQGYLPLSDSHGYRAGRNSRLQMVTNR